MTWVDPTLVLLGASRVLAHFPSSLGIAWLLEKRACFHEERLCGRCVLGMRVRLFFQGICTYSCTYIPQTGICIAVRQSLSTTSPHSVRFIVRVSPVWRVPAPVNTLHVRPRGWFI